MKKILHIVLILVAVSLSTQGFSQKIRVACIGNSITAGYGLQNPEHEAYPAALQNLLDKKYHNYTNLFEVKNFGISARTLLMKGDLPWMKEPFFRDVLNYNPNYIIIKLGTNDTKPHNWKYGDEFQKDLETMIAILQSLPSNPRIILCYPIPVYENEWGIRDEILVSDIIPIITRVANNNGFAIVDLHSNMAKNLYLQDNVHPNIEGSKVIAEKIFNSVFDNIEIVTEKE